MRHTSTVLLSLLALPGAALGYDVKPFKVDLSSRVSHLKELVKLTKLPETSVLGKAGAGTDLGWLKTDRKTGSEGSFYEFHEVIGPLSNPGSSSNISFHVVVPSLPGFGFSSPAPPGWTLNNTADLFNTLLTEVLGYRSYTASGGDWKQRLRNNLVFTTEGFGYFIEHSNRPATIGLALYDNPIGQLAWISDLYFYGADPLIGVTHSTLDNNTILTSVSLYYLTRTFETTVNVYYQNQGQFTAVSRHAVNRVPMGFADYRYELQYYPEFYLQQVGNLVYHSEHERGGHFGALDNPPAYVDDVRTMMGRWYKP
ncbi:epoxide hydrolase [Rhizoctonia solani]|uniref:Epoxide hydrolase n=1 Tax=Rhizoctonia solani TaxID=456999 RepID=A0A8H8NYK8_9AGAM|nr:epoxide hydrolase [Rhizoctonia solani]QRW20693.1 epoxide hydrolase [Rhizoctonia solani]